jgi:ATP-dependent Lon protease
MSAPREIGIFALGTVLVPGELMPLHIFEPRYKELIGDCERDKVPFLLLFTDDQGTRELGCTAQLVEVVDRFDDGRMNIVVEGRDVVKVLEVTRGRQYTTAVVEPAPDALTPEGDQEAALALYRQIAEAGGGDPQEDLLASARPLSYAIMARVEFPSDEKQRLLELRSESDRLSGVTELLARGLQTLEAMARVRERARTNGKVDRG